MSEWCVRGLLMVVEAPETRQGVIFILIIIQIWIFAYYAPLIT